MLRTCYLILLSFVSLSAIPVNNARGHNPAAEDLALAATRFLSTLTPEQVKMAKFELTDAERTNYHFVPDRMVSSEGRRGLPIKAMRSDQRALAYSIPASALSHRGYLQATTIMALEKILFDKEKDLIRDPERYYVSIFGTPDAHGTWGWRFEGHHLAINMTIVDGEKFSVTPTFMGTNPGKVSDGMLAGTEVLQQEGDLGLELANSLTAEQMKLAIIKDTSGYEVKERDNVVWEILTNQEPNADRKEFAFKGIAFDKLTSEQQSMLLRLVNLYAGKYRDEVLAGTRYRGKILDGSKLSFAWLGGLKRSQMHYYCVQSEAFVIEYANSRNDVNHAHAVWREFEGDFGRDLLGEHLREHHKAK